MSLANVSLQTPAETTAGTAESSATTFTTLFSYQPVLETLLKYLPHPANLMETSKGIRAAVRNCFDNDVACENAPSIHHSSDFSLRSAPEICRRNKIVAVAALFKNGFDYEFLSDELKKDQTLIHIALSSVTRDRPENLDDLIGKIPNHVRSSKSVLKLIKEFRTRKGCFKKIEALANTFYDPDVFRAIPWRVLSVCVFKKPLIEQGTRTREILKFLAEKEPGLLQWAGPEWQKDREVVKILVQHFGDALFSVSPELKNDREIVELAVRNNGRALLHANKRFWNDSELAKIALQTIIACHKSQYLYWNPSSLLKILSPELRDDFEIVALVIQISPLALEHASPRLQNNRELVKLAVQKDGDALLYASPELRNDEEILVLALQTSPIALALQTSPLALKHASPRLQNDRNIVKLAIQKNAEAFLYASRALKSERDLLLFAMIHANLQFGITKIILAEKEHFKVDQSLIKIAIALKIDQHWFFSQLRSNHSLSELNDLFTTPEMKKFRTRVRASDLTLLETKKALFLHNLFPTDPDLFFLAITMDEMSFSSAGAPMKGNREVVLKVVHRNGLELQHASSNLKRDKEVVKVALKQNGLAFQFVDESLQADVVLPALASVLSFAPENLSLFLEMIPQKLKEQKGIKELLQRIQADLQKKDFFLPSNIKNYLLSIVKMDGMAIDFVADSFKNDQEIVLQALFQNGVVFSLLSAADQRNLSIVKTALASVMRDQPEKIEALLAIIPPEIRETPLLKSFVESLRLTDLRAWNKETCTSLFKLFPEDIDLYRLAIEYDGLALQYAGKTVKNKITMICRALKQAGFAYQYLEGDMRKVPIVVKIAIASVLRDQPNKLEELIHLIPSEVQDAIWFKDFVAKLRVTDLKSWDKKNFASLSDLFPDDSELYPLAIMADGFAQGLAMNISRKNESILRTALRRNGMALRYVPIYWIKNIKIFSEALKQNGLAYQYLDEDGKRDPLSVKLALASILSDQPEKREELLHMIPSEVQNSEWFKDFTEKLRRADMRMWDKKNFTSLFTLFPDDSDFCRLAVTDDGLALRIASNVVLNNLFIVQSAVNQNGMALQYAPVDLKKQAVVISNALKQNGLAYQYLERNIQNCRPFIKIALASVLCDQSHRLEELLQMILPEIRDSVWFKEFVIKLCTVDVRMWDKENFTQLLKLYPDDPDLCMIAVMYDGMALKVASNTLRNDESIVRFALVRKGIALQHVSSDLKKRVPVFCDALRQNGLAYQFLEEETKKDFLPIKIALASVMNSNPKQLDTLLAMIPTELRDFEIIKSFIAQLKLVDIKKWDRKTVASLRDLFPDDRDLGLCLRNFKI